MTEKEILVLKELDARYEELVDRKIKLTNELMEVRIDMLEVKKLKAVNKQNYTEAAGYRDEQLQLEKKSRFDK